MPSMTTFFDDSVLLRRADEETSEALINVFISLQLLGLFGGILVLFTVVFSSIAQRHITWYNFILSWIIFTTSYSLLFFSGQLKDAVPDLQVCVAQAALVYAAPPLAAAATMGLVIQIWFSVRKVLSAGIYRSERMWTIFILALPYIVHLSIILETILLAAHSPDTFKRTKGSRMYCNTSNPVPGRVSTGLVVVFLAPTLIFEGLIMFTLRKNWPKFKTRTQALSMIIRVFCFSLVGLFSIGISLLFFFTLHHGADLNIVVASLPVAAVAIFGSQKDIFETWMFWKRDEFKQRTRKGFSYATKSETSSVSGRSSGGEANV